jgi:F-box and WD-40 domain protein CDC4
MSTFSMIDDSDAPVSLDLGRRHSSIITADVDEVQSRRASLMAFKSSTSSRAARRPGQDSITHPQPRAIPMPSRPPTSPLHNTLPPSAPASPPTPAPSPTPHQRAPSWTNAGENEDAFLRDARSRFSCLDSAERQRFLAEMLNLCDIQQLSFVQNFVSPRLKKDPFKSLPDELCLRVSLAASI